MKSYFSLYKQQGHEIRERNCEYPTFPNKIGLNHRNLGTRRYISTAIYSMRTLRDQTLTFYMSTSIIPTFSKNPQSGIAASASASTVFLPPRHPTTLTQAVAADVLSGLSALKFCGSGPASWTCNLHSCTGPCSEGPCAGLLFCCHHLQSLVFEQGISHFHLSLGPENYETSPAMSLKEIQTNSHPSPKTCSNEKIFIRVSSTY